MADTDDKIKVTSAEWATLSPHIWTLVGSLIGCISRPTKGKVRRILKEAEDLSQAIRGVL